MNKLCSTVPNRREKKGLVSMATELVHVHYASTIHRTVQSVHSFRSRIKKPCWLGQGKERDVNTITLCGVVGAAARLLQNIF
jgi:hypothetical protein